MKFVVVALLFGIFINGYFCLNCDGRTEEKRRNGCERTCQYAFAKYYPCPIKFPSEACYCKMGYARLAGACVPATQCPITTVFKCVGAGEEFSACGTSTCERRCNYVDVTSTSCPRTCEPKSYRCVCAEGFARNVHGECIRAEEC